MTAVAARPPFRPGAVIFDCDGLLLETESRWTIAETQLLARHGGRYTTEFKKRLLGTSREVSSALIAEELGRPPEHAPALGDELDEYFAVAIAEHGVEPMPGVVELLELLDSRVQIAVASNNGEAFVRRALEQTELARYFHAVVCAGGPLAGKPAPDVYLAAASALGVEPSCTVALEDSVTGATAARAAGCFTIGVPSFPGTELAAAHATYGSMAHVGLAELSLDGSGSTV